MSKCHLCLVFQFKGNHDRAWNDPPVFSYQQTTSPDSSKEDSSTTLTNTRKTLLNKRVAFPLSSGSMSTQQPLLPPTAVMPPKSSEPPTAIVSATPNCIQSDGNPVLDETSKNLEANSVKISNTLENCVMNFLESEKQSDFTRRLQGLFTSLKDGKLNQDVTERLMLLCSCLEDKDFVKAEKIQVALAVDYIAECASWIMVLKNIINEMKRKCDV